MGSVTNSAISLVNGFEEHNHSEYHFLFWIMKTLISASQEFYIKGGKCVKGFSTG